MSASPDLSIWEHHFEGMRLEHETLRASGQWRSGRRTLLQALGLQGSEIPLCRALVWALTPDGWHGAGVVPLRAFLARVGVPHEELDDQTLLGAQIVREESKNNREQDATRADIVIRLPRWSRTVVVEAKVNVVEQPRQAARLEELWASEDPLFVFLSPSGNLPSTRAAGGGSWEAITWRDVAKILRQAAQSGAASPGYYELIETLEIFGGHRHA